MSASAPFIGVSCLSGQPPAESEAERQPECALWQQQSCCTAFSEVCAPCSEMSGTESECSVLSAKWIVYFHGAGLTTIDPELLKMFCKVFSRIGSELYLGLKQVRKCTCNTRVLAHLFCYFLWIFNK